MLQKATTVLMLFSLSLLAVGSIPNQQKFSCYMTLQPIDSIQKAIDIAPPGTTICLQPGLYNQGDIMVDNAWLTLRGAGTGKTLIIGSFSVSWSSEWRLRGRQEPSTREVRLQDLTVLNPVDTSAAIRTIYLRTSGYKPGRIILEGVELIGDPKPLLSHCTAAEGIVLENDMELKVSNSTFYGFETAIEAHGAYGDANLMFKIKVSNSSFFKNCKAILAAGGSLELVESRVEHNDIGMLIGMLSRSTQALIRKTVIAEQGGVGIALWGNSQVRIEGSQIVRNGIDMLGVPVYSVDQTLDPFDVLRGSGISIGGKPSYEGGEKPTIVLSIQGGMITENVGWGIGAALAKCGNFAGEDDEFEVQVTLDNVEISNNNRNWLMEGDICLP